MHVLKHGFLLGLVLLLTALLISVPLAVAGDRPTVFRIADIQLNQNTGQILIRGDHRLADTDAKNYSVVKLPGPYRLVMDIPEATPPM